MPEMTPEERARAVCRRIKWPLWDGEALRRDIAAAFRQTEAATEARARADERERCAKVAARTRWVSIHDRLPPDGWMGWARHHNGVEPVRLSRSCWNFTDRRQVAVWGCGITHWLDSPPPRFSAPKPNATRSQPTEEKNNDDL